MAAIPKLTKRYLDALKAREERYDVYEQATPGFGCRVMPDGRRIFSLIYRAGAVQRRLTIGDHGALTLEQARHIANQKRAVIAAGGDPASDRDAAKDAPTVAALGVDYLSDVAARRKTTTATEYRRQWAKHVEPALGSKRVADVTTADVAKLHRTVGKNNGPYLANRVVALVGAFFTYAERQGVRLRHTNPATDVEPFDERERERFLTPEEIGRLGEALTRAEREGLPPAPRPWRPRKTGKSAKHRPKSVDAPRPADPFAVAAIRFLLLSGWREQEAMTLRWDALDPARGFATLTDTKTGKSQRPLGAPAVLLLSELPRVEGSPYVFPGRKEGRPLADARRVWEAARLAAGLEGVRLHDLRHSFASISASAGGSLLVIGKLLGHRDSKTTQKYAHLLDSPVKAAADVAAVAIADHLRGTPAMRVVR
ncbi:MAG TPA: tyrosine-type recombinase/integrase [Gemmatimonadaceae bacterium]|jgi:integrase|nr:tyrosine-type recombinase/integrase [Gemmatimonadaceae bacterium]